MIDDDCIKITFNSTGRKCSLRSYRNISSTDMIEIDDGGAFFSPAITRNHKICYVFNSVLAFYMFAGGSRGVYSNHE